MPGLRISKAWIWVLPLEMLHFRSFRRIWISFPDQGFVYTEILIILFWSLGYGNSELKVRTSLFLGSINSIKT